MSLEQFCRRPVVAVSPERNILEACQLLEKENIGCVVAQEDGKVCGILTDRDIALKVTGQNKDPSQTKVEEVMTPNPIRISVDKSLAELTDLMRSIHVRRIPIVDDRGRAVGMVTLDDLIALLGDEIWDMGKTVTDALTHGTRQGRSD